MLVDKGEESEAEADSEEPEYIEEDEQTAVEGIKRDILKRFGDASEAQNVRRNIFCPVVCTNCHKM